MTYVSISRGEIKKLEDVNGPAIFKSLSGRKDWCLVKSGDEGYVAYLEGEGFGKAFPWGGIKSKLGLAIEGITIEVDDESSFDTNKIHMPRGGLIRSQDGWGIAVELNERGMTDGCVIDIEGQPLSEYRFSLGYSKWRIRIEEAGQWSTVLEVEGGDMVETV